VSGSRPRNLLRGIARIATGRADGLEEFGTGMDAVAASLLPLAVLPAVGTLISLLNGAGWLAIRDLFVVACALLAPLVASHALARVWGREALWPRFAAAFNWCQWAIPIVALLVLFAAALLVLAGLPTETAGVLVVFGLLGYALWLHWFLARAALRLAGLSAAAMVAIMNLATLFCVAGPRLLTLALA